MRKKKDLPKLNVPERFQPFEDVSLEIRHPEKYYIAANKEVIKNIKKSPWRIIFDFPKKKICKHKKKTAAVFEKYKKYNPTELRFLQLLLPGQTFFDVLMYNFNQAIENAFLLLTTNI